MKEPETTQENNININKNKNKTQESGEKKKTGDWEVNLNRMLRQEEEAIFSRRSSTTKRTPTKGESTSGIVDDDDPVPLEKSNTEAEEDVFKRRGSTARSPQGPRHSEMETEDTIQKEEGNSSPSAPETDEGSPDDDVVFVTETVKQKEKKRKFQQSPEYSKDTVIIKDGTLKKIYKKIKDMNDFKDTNQNVHKALKDAIACLRSWSYSYAKQLEEKEKEGEREESENHEAMQLALEIKCKMMEEETAALRKEIAELKETNKELTEANKTANVWKKNIVTKEKVQGIKNYEDFEALKDAVWPEHLFKNVKEKEGNPLNSENQTSIVIAEPSDPNMDKSIQRMYAEKYPQLREMHEGIGILKNITTVTESGKTKEISKTVIKITPKDLAAGLWDAFKEVREQVAKDDTKRITVHRLASKGVEEIKRMLQAVFENTEVMATLHKPTEERRTKFPQIRTSFELEAIEIRKKGTYMEVLTEVKKSMMASNLKGEIKTVRSTKSGTVLLVLSKEANAAEIGKRIKEDIPECRVNGLKQIRRTNLHQVYIRGMEATVSKEEVEDAIKKIAGTETEYKISEIRPGRLNITTVTVSAPLNVTDELLKLKTIKVGLSEGRVEHRINIQRCHRCWEHGHLMKDCTGVDRRNTCYRCSQEGHKATECKEDPKCPLCGVEGHATGGRGCQEKRREINKKRKMSWRSQNLNTDERDPALVDSKGSEEESVIEGGRPFTPAPPISVVSLEKL